MKSTGFSFLKLARQFCLLLLSVLALSFLLTACGPAKKYAGPTLPDEEIAVIKPGDKMFTHVNILSVDKYALYTDERSIAVHPGVHTVFFEAFLDYPFLDKDLYFNQYLTFNAEAGQTYTIDATVQSLDKRGFAWVSSEKDPKAVIVKKYAVDLIPLPSSD